MLSSLGVPSSFLNILDQLYLNVESVGVVNGKPGGVSGRCRWYIQGLRQGCPASPLLMALWVQHAIQEIKKKGFHCVSYADDIWIVCPQESQDEAKRCMQSAFAGAGLTINPLKVKVWTPSPLEILGMTLFDGRRLSISECVLQKARNLLSGGREREFSCFKRVMYVNTVCLPSLRYKISALLLYKSRNLIKSIDRMLRNFVRGKDWPSNTPTDFLSDTHIGLSSLSLHIESLRDLFSFVWGLTRGRESDALRTLFLQAWKDRGARSCRSLSLLDDWIDCVDAIDGKSFFDWNDEERDLPQALRSDSVFPFGAKGSFLRNTLQKWPSQQKPPPPCCRNDVCYLNPCPILASARDKKDTVIWVTDAGKVGTRSRKGLFASIVEGGEAARFAVSCVAVPVLETGCVQILRDFCVAMLPGTSVSFPHLHATPFSHPALTTPSLLSSLSLLPSSSSLSASTHFSHVPACTAAVSPDIVASVSPNFATLSAPLSLSSFSLASSSPPLFSQTRGTPSPVRIALPASLPSFAPQQISLGTDATASEEREHRILLICPRQTREFHPSFLA